MFWVLPEPVDHVALQVRKEKEEGLVRLGHKEQEVNKDLVGREVLQVSLEDKVRHRSLA